MSLPERHQPLSRRYAQNPIGEALYHKGQECKKQWFALCKAQGNVSNAVKQMNMDCKRLYGEMLSNDANNHHDQNQQGQSAGLKVASYEDAQPWHRCLVQNCTTDAVDSVFVDCPWKICNLATVFQNKGLIDMQSWALHCIGELYNSELQQYLYAFGMHLIDPGTKSITRDQAASMFGEDTMKACRRVDQYYSIKTERCTLLLLVHSEIMNTHPSKEMENVPWVHRVLHECKAQSTMRVFHFSMFAIANTPGAKPVTYCMFKFYTSMVHHAGLFIEDSTTACTVISSTLGASSGEDSENRRFTRRQTVPIETNPHPIPINQVSDENIMRRICRLQLNTAKICLVNEYCKSIGKDGKQIDEEYVKVEQLPKILAVSVQSCQFRLVDSSDGRQKCAIITSRINLVGDDKVDNAAATLHVRTVYCLHQFHQWPEKYRKNKLSMRENFNSGSILPKMLASRMGTAGAAGGFSLLNYDGNGAPNNTKMVMTGAKKGKEHRAAVAPAHTAPKEKTRAGHRETKPARHDKTQEQTVHQKQHAKGTAANPKHKKQLPTASAMFTGAPTTPVQVDYENSRRDRYSGYGVFNRKTNRRTASSSQQQVMMMDRGESENKSSRSEEASGLIAQWDRNLVRAATQFNVDLDHWMRYTSTRAVPRHKSQFMVASKPPVTVISKKATHTLPVSKKPKENVVAHDPDSEMEDAPNEDGGGEDQEMKDASDETAAHDEGGKDTEMKDASRKNPADDEVEVLNRKRIKATQASMDALLSTSVVPENASSSSSPFSRMNGGPKKLPQASITKQRSCLTPSESMQVLKEHGLVGQGSAVLAAAVLSV